MSAEPKSKAKGEREFYSTTQSVGNARAKRTECQFRSQQSEWERGIR